MNWIADLVALLVVVAGVGAAITLVARWTSLFTDLLWYFVLAPWPVSVAVLLTMIVIGAITRTIAGIELVAPLAFSIQLIVLPFLAVPLSDFLARLNDAARGCGHDGLGWKGYLFASRRLAQREAYAAPRTEQ